MRNQDLARELEAADLGQHTRELQDAMMKQGLDIEALRPLPIQIATISRSGKTFQTVPHGQLACVFAEPICITADHDANTRLLDRVAVPFAEPNVMLTLFGEAWALGKHNLLNHLKHHWPVVINEDFPAWVAGGGQGTVIIDDVRAGQILRAVPVISADSLGHANRLRAICGEPPIIRYPAKGDAALEHGSWVLQGGCDQTARPYSYPEHISHVLTQLGKTLDLARWPALQREISLYANLPPEAYGEYIERNWDLLQHAGVLACSALNDLEVQSRSIVDDRL